MPVGVVVGSALGWLVGGPTAGARLDATLFFGLFLGFVIAPALSAALAAARYRQGVPRPLSGRLLHASVVPAIGGAAWGSLGAVIAIPVAIQADVEIAFPDTPVAGAAIGFVFGLLSGLLTLLLRAVAGSGTEIHSD